MRDAQHNGKLIPASPGSPDVARCPACGGEVHKHRRKVGRSEVTYFYRHRAGIGRRRGARAAGVRAGLLVQNHDIRSVVHSASFPYLEAGCSALRHLEDYARMKGSRG